MIFRTEDITLHNMAYSGAPSRRITNSEMNVHIWNITAGTDQNIYSSTIGMRVSEAPNMHAAYPGKHMMNVLGTRDNTVADTMDWVTCIRAIFPFPLERQIEAVTEQPPPSISPIPVKNISNG